MVADEWRNLLFRYGLFYPAVLSRGQFVPVYLNRLCRSQWLPMGQLHQIQERKLIDLASFCQRNIPFYRSYWGDALSGELVSRDRLPLLPTISKATLQSRLSEMVLKGAWPVTKKTTGGSTGQAVTIWKSADAMAQEIAANWRGFGWAGVQIGDRQGRFWGTAFHGRDRLKARLIDLANHRKRCSAFSFTEANMREYTQVLNRFRPNYLYGYVSMLDAYAQFLESSSLQLDYPLKAVIGTSEVLTSAHRRTFEKVFHCPVYNEYGCGEIGTIAHECEKGGLHINAENMIVEIVRDGQACAPGELGEIVVTELNNRALPLVRYQLGDHARLSRTPCSCGRTLPVLEEVAGRAYDMVRNRQGQRFHGEFFMYIFEEVRRKGLGVQAFQVIQVDYDNITIRVVSTKGYCAETEALIQTRIRGGYGAGVTISFKHVEEISREPSGKMRLIVGYRPSSTG